MMKSTDKEKWTFIDKIGIEKMHYQVSDLGRVYNTVTQSFIGSSPDLKTGFIQVSLKTLTGRTKKFLLHLLVLESFQPAKAKEAKKLKWQAIHKNGNIRNNELDNLMYGPRAIARKQRKGELSQIKK